MNKKCTKLFLGEQPGIFQTLFTFDNNIFTVQPTFADVALIASARQASIGKQ
jgi:hypothetical protein